MKNNKKQEFSSSNILTLLGLVLLSALMIIAPWNLQTRDSKVQAARQKAEVVGYQVVQIYRESIKVSMQHGKSYNRGPASAQGPGHSQSIRKTGTMGLDPWGQPYHYRLIPSDKAGALRILVLSAGPNKKIETVEFNNEEAGLTGQPNYLGDDIGVVLSVSQN
ncbi:MAG: hypothetical protein ACXVCY_12950 [Pseudobdellovibrionaceae bacterium]